MGKFTDELLKSGKAVHALEIGKFMALGNGVFENTDNTMDRGLLNFYDMYELFIGHMVLSQLINDGRIIEGYADNVVELSGYLASCKKKIDGVDVSEVQDELYVFAFESENMFICLRADEFLNVYEDMIRFEGILKDRVRELVELGHVDFSEYFVDFSKLGRFFDGIDNGVLLNYVCSIPEESLRELSTYHDFLYDVCAEEMTLNELNGIGDKIDDIKKLIEIISVSIDGFDSLDAEIPIFDTCGERVDLGIIFEGFEVGPSRFDIGLWTIYDGIHLMLSRIEDIERQLAGRV